MEERLDTSAHQLPRPPTAAPLQEPPAIIEPPLRGMPPAPTGEIEEWEPFESERQEPPGYGDVLEAAQVASMASDRVRAVLEGRRTVVLGVSQLVDTKEQEQPQTVLLAYDYEQAREIEVLLVEAEGELRVDSVREAEAQPSPSDEEIERAITLARESDRVAPHLHDGWEANALLTSSVSPGDQHFGQRRIVVVFGPADERLPRVRALVDLGLDEVLGVDTRSDAVEEGTP